MQKQRFYLFLQAAGNEFVRLNSPHDENPGVHRSTSREERHAAPVRRRWGLGEDSDFDELRYMPERSVCLHRLFSLGSELVGADKHVEDLCDRNEPGHKDSCYIIEVRFKIKLIQHPEGERVLPGAQDSDAFDLLSKNGRKLLPDKPAGLARMLQVRENRALPETGMRGDVM